MRVKSRKPLAALLQHLLAGFVGQIVGGAADGEGEQMRQMADHGQHAVMVRRLHHIDHAAHAAPQGFYFRHTLGIRAGRWGEAGTSGPGTIRRNRNRGRNTRCRPAGGRARNARRSAPGGPDIADDGLLGGAYIRQDRAGGQGRGDGGGEAGEGADGGAENDANRHPPRRGPGRLPRGRRCRVPARGQGFLASGALATISSAMPP